MEDSEDMADPATPATPDLFNGSYYSDGRATPDDTSSLDGMTTTTACQPKRKRRGRPPVYLSGEPMDGWTDLDKGTQYKVGDFVFFDGRKTGDPYRIGTVMAIRQSKKDRTVASIKLYFRSCQLPEGVYQRLMEDRNSENLGGFADFLIANPIIKARELFKSEKSEVIRCHSVRGKCSVIQLTDVQSVRRFVPDPDTFFTLLGYNPDTRRLATIQGEIRIGFSHQAKLPECNPSVPITSRPARSMPEGIGGGDHGEEKLWSPGRIPGDELEVYIAATKSMVASFTNMAERKSVDESVATAGRDENTQLAFNQLHRADYDKNTAVSDFAKSVPLARSIDRRWEEEDSKKFMKGLRVFGKNFFRIRKEFLPEKETKELVEYYYYWKKTPISTVPNRTGRRQKSRNKAGPAGVGGTSSKAPSSSAGDNSSESEEVESNESYTCFRCDTESSNQWHYVDQHGFVCESCKLNYRKYGDENGEKIPEYLFRPVEPASNYRRPPPKRELKEDGTEGTEEKEDVQIPDAEAARKSPSASSTSSNSSNTKQTTPRKRKSPGKAKRSIMSGESGATAAIAPITDIADTDITPKKEPVEDADADEEAKSGESESETMPLSEVVNKKKKLEQASPDSLASELNREDADPEDNGNMGDVEQDDNSTTNSPHSPAPSDESLNVEEVVQPDNSIAEKCHEPCGQFKNAHFVRCLKRAENSCSRSDVFYIPPPGSDMAKKREDKRKPLAITQPSVAPPLLQEIKVKPEPIVSSDVIRHTSQSQHPMRATVPPTSMSLPSPHHHMAREHRMTPNAAHAHAAAMASAAQHQAQAHHAAAAAAAQGHHHPHTPVGGGHRVTTPSQRVTPRSQSSEQHPGMLHPGHHSTPALSQLSQLAGRPQHPSQQQPSIEDMARMAALSSNPAAAMAAAAGMGGGMPGSQDAAMMQLQYYRLMKSVVPSEQIDRLFPPEIRERFEMALKAQDMEAHQKMLSAHQAQAMAQSVAQAQSAQLDPKAFLEAQMLDVQRKLGMPPGMPPGAAASMGLPGMPGFMPPTSMSGMSGSNASEMRARELEKMQKLGILSAAGMLGGADPLASLAASNHPAERLAAERLSAERLAAERLSAERLAAVGLSAGGAPPNTHTHTHTHLHLLAASAQNPFLAEQLLQSLGPGSAADPAALARAAAAAAAATAGGMPYGHLPPGFPGVGHPSGLNIPTSSASGAGEMPAHIMAALASRPDMDPRELLSMQHLLSNPSAAMAAQQEALQRQFMMERERHMSGHMPH